MYCFYQLFLKPYPRQGSLTSKIKHFKRDSLPRSILGWSYFPVLKTKFKFLHLLQTLLLPRFLD